VPHIPYSPDLAPADAFLFPKLKTTLKGRRFQTIEEIQENAIRELRAIIQNAFLDAFQEAFQQWKNIENSVSPVEGTTLEGVVHKML
jgi:hypothetical protein